MKINLSILTALSLGIASSHASLVWTVGDSSTPGRNVPEIANIYASVGSTTFVQEAGQNALPGDPNSPAVNQQADDDFYFAGQYDNVVDGGAYIPVGIVATTEVGVERAITSGDTNLRYHFNFAGSHAATDSFSVTLGFLDMDDNATGTGVFNGDILVNGVNVGSFAHSVATINTPFASNTFTLADIGATAGAPDDNYVEIRTSNGGSTARWANVDYVQMDVTQIPEPSSLGFLAIAAAGMVLIRRRK